MNLAVAGRRKLSGYWMTGDSRHMNDIASEQLHVRPGRVDSPEPHMKAGSFIRLHASLAVLRRLFNSENLHSLFVATRLFKINSVPPLSFSSRSTTASRHVILKGCITGWQSLNEPHLPVQSSPPGRHRLIAAPPNDPTSSSCCRVFSAASLILSTAHRCGESNQVCHHLAREPVALSAICSPIGPRNAAWTSATWSFPPSCTNLASGRVEKSAPY